MAVCLTWAQLIVVRQASILFIQAAGGWFGPFPPGVAWAIWVWQWGLVLCGAATVILLAIECVLRSLAAKISLYVVTVLAWEVVTVGVLYAYASNVPVR